MSIDKDDFTRRFRGGILGTALGDALGVPHENRGREYFEKNPVISMDDDRAKTMPVGFWSDDTSLTLCLLEALVEFPNDEEEALNAAAQYFVDWKQNGRWTPDGNPFGIGWSTSLALEGVDRGVPPTESGLKGDGANGNGSLMRNLPVGLVFAGETNMFHLTQRAHDFSKITHAHPRSQMACGLHAHLTRQLALGVAPAEAWNETRVWAQEFYSEIFPDEMEHFNPFFWKDAAAIAALPAAEIHSSGYVMHTWEAALWCLFSTSDFTSCVLKAVNLGEDTDTTAAVAGGLAGTAYCEDNLLPAWLALLPRRKDILALCDRAIQ